MDEKKGKGSSIFLVIFIIITILLGAGLVYMFLENQKLNNKILELDKTAILSEKDKTIEQLQKEITELNNKTTAIQTTTPVTTSSESTPTLKNYYDTFSKDDTKLVKAQKIAKEFTDAVNNKDWYYLAKIGGSAADNYIEYGIHNYKLDVNQYEQYDDEYVFNATFDWDKSKLGNLKDISLGTMFIVTFHEGGRIEISPNCTGI